MHPSTNKSIPHSVSTIRIQGTQVIVDLCRQHNVPRLVFSSTANVALRPYLGRATFAAIINQTESKALTPTMAAADGDSSCAGGFLIPGYPASKLRAEELVLQANGTPLANGSGKCDNDGDDDDLCRACWTRSIDIFVCYIRML